MPITSQECAACGHLIDRWNENYFYCDDCNEYRCDDCGECVDNSGYPRRDPRVHTYDYRPNPWNPKGEFPMRPLMGVELEVHNYNIDFIPEVVQEFDDTEDHLYVKEDGSLDSGLEIVSHPATLEWTRTYPWSDLLRRLRQEDSSAPDGHGLHVHVSRNAFRRQGKRSPTHQLTWLLFLHRNPRQLERLARRSDTQWAKFSKPSRGELVAKAHAHNGYGSDRYVAVNCNNQKTYELRFFKSTLDYGEFMAAIEFADASVEYTRGIKTADVLKGQALSWPHFARWAEDHDYPNLSDQIEIQETEDVTTPLEEVVNRRREPRRRDGFDYITEEGRCTCAVCRSSRAAQESRTARQREYLLSTSEVLSSLVRGY